MPKKMVSALYASALTYNRESIVKMFAESIHSVITMFQDQRKPWEIIKIIYTRTHTYIQIFGAQKLNAFEE